MDHQAFAQLLGNYGEFVGAFAVVATLVYLAIQIKSARVASEASHIAIKGNSGGELNTVEQFAFDQLVESMAEVHFFAFVRTRTLGGSLDERIPASNLAEFLHRYPVAYERWQAQEDTYVGTRRAMGIPESANALGDDWIRMVTDAVATLEKSE
jgi:hypothetical protein